jgi:hypothetical protein
MSVQLVCPTCGAESEGSDNLVERTVHCFVCDDKLLLTRQALTYVDEIPHEEYLGG